MILKTLTKVVLGLSLMAGAPLMASHDYKACGSCKLQEVLNGCPCKDKNKDKKPQQPQSSCKCGCDEGKPCTCEECGSHD